MDKHIAFKFYNTSLKKIKNYNTKNTKQVSHA